MFDTAKWRLVNTQQREVRNRGEEIKKYEFYVRLLRLGPKDSSECTIMLRVRRRKVSEARTQHQEVGATSDIESWRLLRKRIRILPQNPLDRNPFVRRICTLQYGPRLDARFDS